MFKQFLTYTSFTSLLLLASAPNAMAFLIGSDWGASSNLYSIDPSSNTATLIGPTGQGPMIGLVVDIDNTIYAISEEPNSRLWTLDFGTGSATLVGSLGFNLQEGDITIDPITGDMYVADGAGDNLYIVDKTTATANLVGSFGASGRDVSGLQFINGTLYGFALRNGNPDVLGTVDPTTGLFTTIGETGTNCGVIAAMGRDPANGITYIGCPNSDFGNNNSLYSLNLTTGAATLVGSLSGITYSVSGFSVAGDPPILRTTPEPTSIFALFGISFLGIAIKRQKHF